MGFLLLMKQAVALRTISGATFPGLPCAPSWAGINDAFGVVGDRQMPCE